MIRTSDRSYWIGASDTDKVVGNWKTKTWEQWWMQVRCLKETPNWSNKYTMAGTMLEHGILRKVDASLTLDYQVKIPELSLRVNYDGVDMKSLRIYEVKTHKNEFKLSKTYWRQAQAEMFALNTDKLDIVAYQMTEIDYVNYFGDIEVGRISYHKVERDDEFIDGLYVPRLEYLHSCMEKGKWPRESEL